MKVRTNLVVLLSASVLLIVSAPDAISRGGGGGGRGGGGFGGGGRSYGGFGGGYDRGGFDRGGYDRGGYGNFDQRADDFLRGRTGRSDIGGESMGDQMRPSAFSQSARTSDSDLRSAADHEYGTVNEQHAVATDNGFAHMASSIPAGAHTYRVPANDLTARGVVTRNEFHDYDAFNRGWWGDHPDAWRYPYYGTYGWGYGYGGWGDLSGFWGMPADYSMPEYDYGENITYNNNEVYYGTQPTCTADQYYQQAQSLANAPAPTSTLVASQPSGSMSIDGTPPNADAYKSLGVFSLTQGSQTDSTSLFQLTTDKDGVIRGNYCNELTGDVEPIQGSVDKKSMRVAWTVGDSKTTVYDTGMSNLLKDQSPILVHFGKDRTEQWTLVRLNPPKPAASTPTQKPS